jgi:adhesin/invasin
MITATGSGNELTNATTMENCLSLFDCGLTDIHGQFTADLLSGGVGMKTVTATVAGISDTVTVSFVPDPVLTHLSASAQAAFVGAPVTVTATVAHNEQGVPVSFTSRPAGADFLSPVVAITDNSGEASVTVTSNTPIPFMLITASAGMFGEAASLSFYAVPSAAKSTLVPNEMSVPADNVTPISLLLTALDDNGMPVANLPVTFVSSLMGSTFTPSSGQTASDGTLTVALTSSLAGQATIAATALGMTVGTASVQFSP